MSTKLTYISLFSSAGIGCYGFKQQGFECIATNELLEKRMSIQKYNHKCKYETGYIIGDIENSDTQDRILSELDFWYKNENIKELDILVATPPCQGMSVANHKKTDNEIKRNSLILQSILLTKKIQPKYFVFENVRAFLKTLCTDIDGVDKSIEVVIKTHLESIYNIEYKIINFKEYGVPSSRTRTLIVGVRKNIYDISPLDLFPKEESQKILKEVIGDFPSLKNMGDISDKDIYHFYRSYDRRMLPWIEKTKEGYSAFDNELLEYKPHKIGKDGEIILNQNKNGDKYKRNSWDAIAPCIHTRNDILASQSTIHPSDSRVFSIRELMIIMSIPNSFQWSDISENRLNNFSLIEKRAYLKTNELNIRHSIGEAVPTYIFNQIAKNIINVTNESSINNVKKIINENELDKSFKTLKDFVLRSLDTYSFKTLSKIIEFSNAQRTLLSAYYTPSNIVHNIVSHLPKLKTKKEIYVLEPSVGIGNFLPSIIDKYANQNLIIDVIDIDSDMIELLSILFDHFYPNVKINYINSNFLLFNSDNKYDIVIGNPPYGKSDKDNLFFKKNMYNTMSCNIFTFFIEKAKSLGKHVAFVIPKSFLSSPEYDKTRELLERDTSILSICDYGEKSFYNVKIETIGLIFYTEKKENTIVIDSFVNKSLNIKHYSKIFDKEFNMWLLYTDDFFYLVKQKLEFDIFNFYRDRQITKKHTKNLGKYRILKSRNIDNLSIKDIPDYDSYTDEIENLSVKKYLNTNSVLIPNLSYNPRACFLPKNMITDGSVAILTPVVDITEKDLEYFSTDEFKTFYMIGRNHSKRSLNIDRNSIRLWGKYVRL